ncbi:MAG: amidohydrolase [Deltaproteobacteria bacterium]|nr:amidohydrolase [Deltaproteobacteria bacterium]
MGTAERSDSKGPTAEATLLVENARIRTLDERGTVAESLAAMGDRIIAVGSNKELAGLAGRATERLDLEGRTVLPGFIDAHEHLSSFAEMFLQVDLSPDRVRSLSELAEVIRSEAERLPEGEWIRGILYDDTKMEEQRLLTRDDLDRVAPRHPVIVSHVSLHWGIANSEALRRGGLDETSPDPEGGRLGRDPATGRLTGQLIEAAFFRFADQAMSGEPVVVPPFDRGVRRRALVEAAKVLNSAGLTSVVDALVSSSYVTSYLDTARERSLPLRVNMLLSYFLLHDLEGLGLLGGWGNELVRSTGIKVILDGAIAGRTAAFGDGYADNPEDHGVLVIEDQGFLNELVERIHRLGYQACLHANGDVAIEMALDAIGRAEEIFPRPDPRHRIEHCTVINERILERMGLLGVLAVPFGSYLWQHGEKLIPYYGRERVETMFAHRSFLEKGIRVAGSSDHPCGLHPPLLGVQTMVTRQTKTGEVVGSWQKISIEEAFKMYTSHAAYASFEEDVKGSLTVGRLSDMVVLEEDPWDVLPGEIGEIGVTMTILGGRVVYRSL